MFTHSELHLVINCPAPLVRSVTQEPSRELGLTAQPTTHALWAPPPRLRPSVNVVTVAQRVLPTPVNSHRHLAHTRRLLVVPLLIALLVSTVLWARRDLVLALLATTAQPKLRISVITPALLASTARPLS